MATVTSKLPSRTATRRTPATSYLAKAWPLYLMIIPALLILIVFNYYPMYGVITAFQNFNPGLGFTNSPWVGFANFEQLFRLPDFGRIVLNTVFISISKIATVQFCAVVLALMINEVRSALFRRSIQTVVYLPYFLSWIVLGGILIDLLSVNGLINQFLVNTLGTQPILFLGSNQYFVPTLIVSNAWKEVGFSTIVYLAALTGIDPQLHEAAAIDGAKRLQRILFITLPGIMPVIVLLVALNLGNVLQAGFEQVLTLYNPAVYRTGDILDTYIYRMGLISARYSLAAAVGLFKSVVGFVLILISYRLADRYAGFRIF